MNLSRFFSPTVVSDLQDASANLDLERRNAAVMFIDIRRQKFAKLSVLEFSAGPVLLILKRSGSWDAEAPDARAGSSPNIPFGKDRGAAALALDDQRRRQGLEANRETRR